jgi:hypothetical protein
MDTVESETKNETKDEIKIMQSPLKRKFILIEDEDENKTDNPQNIETAIVLKRRKILSEGFILCSIQPADEKTSVDKQLLCETSDIFRERFSQVTNNTITLRNTPMEIRILVNFIRYNIIPHTKIIELMHLCVDFKVKSYIMMSLWDKLLTYISSKLFPTITPEVDVVQVYDNGHTLFNRVFPSWCDVTYLLTIENQVFKKILLMFALFSATHKHLKCEIISNKFAIEKMCKVLSVIMSEYDTTMKFLAIKSGMAQLQFGINDLFSHIYPFNI